MKDAKLDERVLRTVGAIAEANTEGLNKLASEEMAEKRRNESKLSACKRKVKKTLGLRKSGVQKIDI